MRPYIAIIRDSFREAFATKVLWIVLLLIALFLGILAPFGYEVAIATKLQFGDFRDPRQFVTTLIKAREDASSPAGYVWSRLSEELKRDLQNLTKDSPRRERMGVFGRVREELNELLSERDLYRENVWKDVRLTREGRDLLEKGIDSLSEEELARFNRLSLDAAFRKDIEPAGSEAIQVKYLTFSLADELPITETQAREIVNQFLVFILAFTVGNIGVLIAIVVTSWIVPTMLESGAIDLLLSKPVSRQLIFLSKFAGGCAFIVVNAVFAISGVWLILGLRLGIWNTGLLWTIPVFVFVFAIYYSVSALAAVLWRNAIVSIIVTVAFWTMCFAVGFTKSWIEDVSLNSRRTSVMAVTSDALIRTNVAGDLQEWNAETNEWQDLDRARREVFGLPVPNPYVGPFADRTNNRLLALHKGSGPPWMRGTPKLAIATAESDWKLRETINFPAGVEKLMIENDGGVLAAGTAGVFRLQGNPAVDDENAVEILGFKLPGFGQPASFNRIDDPSSFLVSPFDAALDVESNRIVILSGTRLFVLTMGNDRKYSVEVETERESDEPATIGISGDRIVEAGENGLIRIRDAKTLEIVEEARPNRKNGARTIACSPDGRWIAVLFHNRRLWTLNTKDGTSAVPSITSQGSISAVSFDAGNAMYVADRFGRIIAYEDGSGLVQKSRFEPPSDLLESLHTYAIRPLHTVFPKPGEMDNVVNWLMTDEETVDDGGGNRIVVDIWEPLWSNLAFLIIMLTVTSLITTRRDF